MTTQQVADRMVELTSQGKFAEAAQELHSPDIVSVEAGAPAGMPREFKGTEAVKEKGEWWTNNHEVHSASVEGPLVAGPYFSVVYKMEVTFKPENRRFSMEEVAIYHVQNGKVVREEFFYGM